MPDLSFIILQIFFQLVAAVLSLIYLRKSKVTFIVLLSIILFSSLLVECIGFYYLTIGKSSFIFHYIYVFINFNLMSFFYYKLINDNFWFKGVIILMMIFNISWVYTFFYKEWLTYIFILGALSIALSIFLYLRELLLSDRILNYKKLLYFWVSVGFLVFYLPSIPFFTLLNYMRTRGLFFILNILIILMNVFIIYGLLCSKKEERY